MFNMIIKREKNRFTSENVNLPWRCKTLPMHRESPLANGTFSSNVNKHLTLSKKLKALVEKCIQFIQRLRGTVTKIKNQV